MPSARTAGRRGRRRRQRVSATSRRSAGVRRSRRSRRSGKDTADTRRGVAAARRSRAGGGQAHRAARRRARRSCARSASASTRSPRRRAVADVTGPIRHDDRRALRAGRPASQKFGDRRRRREGDRVDVAGSDPATTSRVGRRRARCGRRRTTSTRVARAPEAVGQHVAGHRGPRRAGPARPAPSAWEGLEQRLGDEPLGDQVGAHAAAGERGGGAGPDRGDAQPAKRAGVEAARRRGPGRRRPPTPFAEVNTTQSTSSSGRAASTRSGSTTIGGQLERRRRRASRGVARSPLACSRARVTTTCARTAGRRSNQAEVERRRPRRRRSPPARRARRRRASRGWPARVRWSGRVPRCTAATGVSPARPPASERGRDRRRCGRAHEHDERPAGPGERLPVDVVAASSAGSSWPVTIVTCVASPRWVTGIPA